MSYSTQQYSIIGELLDESIFSVRARVHGCRKESSSATTRSTLNWLIGYVALSVERAGNRIPARQGTLGLLDKKHTTQRNAQHTAH